MNRILSVLCGLSSTFLLSIQPVSAAALDKIYQKALSNDPKLKIAEATYRANKERLPQARSSLLPNIVGSANTTYYNTTALDYNNHGYTVSLTQPLFAASDWFSFKRGQILDEQTQLTFEHEQQQQILRVIQSYLDVLSAQSNLETAEAQERAIKRRLDQVNAQFDVGLIAITDVHEAKATYDAARVSLIEAHGSLDNSYEALERLTNEPIPTVDSLSDDFPIELLEPATPDTWVKNALENNLNLKIASLGMASGRQAAKAAKASGLPSLDFQATYDYDNGSTTYRDDVTSKVVGLTLSVPLYQGGAIRSKTREAYAQLDAANETYEDAYREVKQSTRSLIRDIQTAVLSVEARQQSIVSSQAALDATSEGYNVGTRNVVDVLTAEQALYAAKRDYSAARFGYISKLFTLKLMVGSLSPADVAALDQWLVVHP
jgi:outer membrane protein